MHTGKKVVGVFVRFAPFIGHLAIIFYGLQEIYSMLLGKEILKNG
jgi:hypothetical protein